MIGFLTIKELNRKQVRWVKILIEYYFEIKHVKGINNIKADILSRKIKLQNNKKPLEVILYINKIKN